MLSRRNIFPSRWVQITIGKRNSELQERSLVEKTEKKLQLEISSDAPLKITMKVPTHFKAVVSRMIDWKQKILAPAPDSFE